MEQLGITLKGTKGHLLARKVVVRKRKDVEEGISDPVKMFGRLGRAAILAGVIPKSSYRESRGSRRR